MHFLQSKLHLKELERDLKKEKLKKRTHFYYLIQLKNRNEIDNIMHEYRTVRIPNQLVVSITDLIEEMKVLGYRSHSEFIIEAVRRRIEELTYLKHNRENSELNEVNAGELLLKK